MLGSAAPLSHLLTAWRLTPMASATNSWVILQRVRWYLRVSPRLLAISAFSCRTGPERRYFRRALMSSTTR